MIDWGDIGPLSIDPKTSKIQDLVGAVIMPGSTRVLDWDTGKLVDCTPELCPYAIDGVNHAPFAAFGGWSGAINANADPKVIEAAYGFLSYMNQPEQSNVRRHPWAGPATTPTAYRSSRTSTPGSTAGFSREAAENYLGAIGGPEQPEHGVGHAHPGTQRYHRRRARPRAGAGPRRRDHDRGGARRTWRRVGRRSPTSSAATSS